MKLKPGEKYEPIPISIEHLCGCPEFGTYEGYVELVPPDFLKRDDGRGICVDVCLALEITRLWSAGIVTTGCCCGHGRLPPTICVATESEPVMLDLGYTRQKQTNNLAPVFIAKTQLDFNRGFAT